MAAPVPIAHTHVHSLRLRSGVEALVARVLTAEGSAGYGFTLNLDAAVARDMAAWDALAQSRGVAFCELFGGCRRRSVPLVRDDTPAFPPEWAGLTGGVASGRWKRLCVDPFAWESAEQVQSIAVVAAGSGIGVRLLAPNAHPWELSWCAALAATFPGGEPAIALRVEPGADPIRVPDDAGIGVDWSLEPGFAALRW